MKPKETKFMKNPFTLMPGLFFGVCFTLTAFAGAPCDSWDCNEPKFVKCAPQECCCAAKAPENSTKAVTGDIKGWNNGAPVKYIAPKK